MEITRDFESERPGAVRAIRDVFGIPPGCQMLVGDGYVRFWGPEITAEQARPFFLKDIREAVSRHYGPSSCACPEVGSWDQVH